RAIAGQPKTSSPSAPSCPRRWASRSPHHEDALTNVGRRRDMRHSVPNLPCALDSCLRGNDGRGDRALGSNLIARSRLPGRKRVIQLAAILLGGLVAAIPASANEV